MTRRLAIFILLTAWTVLLLAGDIAYFVTRSVLLDELDASIRNQVASLPDVERPGTPIRAIIHDTQGKAVARPASEGAVDVPPFQVLSKTFTTLADGSRLRSLTLKAFSRRTAPDAPLVPVTVTYSAPARHLDALLDRLGLTLGIYGLIASFATAGVAVVIARTALRPLRTTAQTIGEISEKNLDRRIPLDRLPRELIPVAERLNDLFARLEQAFSQRKQFLADASHELRTPVAAMITTLEVTLHKTRSADEYVRALQSSLVDAQLLHHLVSALLDHVRSERFAALGPAAADLAPVQISEMLAHCTQIATALGAQKNIRVNRQIPASLVGITDELKLRSIATNLLSNAIEYTPNGGQVTISLVIDPQARPTIALPADHPESLAVEPRLLRLTISDTGPGISPKHLPHLFQPFYRADTARSHNDHHLGLGLCLVRAHAQSLGGDCRIDETAKTPGATFIVELPVLLLPSDKPDPNLLVNHSNPRLPSLMKD